MSEEAVQRLMGLADEYARAAGYVVSSQEREAAEFDARSTLESALREVLAGTEQPEQPLGVPASPSRSPSQAPPIADAAGHGLIAVGSILRGHLKPQPEPWCRDVFLYSPNNPGDSPEHRVMVYALKGEHD